MLVRDFRDGQEIEQALLVREAELRRRRDGEDFLRLRLSDRSGTVTAVAWDGAAALVEHATPGEPVFVSGRFGIDPRHGGQLTLAAVRPAAAHEIDLDVLLDGPPRSAAAMERDLRELIDTVRDRWLRMLLDRALGPGSEIWRRYRDAPAAKRYHQAYRHGLLEHSLSVAQAVSAISATFPGIDRDVAVTGALLHDIGKLDAYTADALSIDMTDAGRLQGEIALGYYRIRRLIEEIEDFPPGRAQAVLHIVLSHHGALEFGSPVVPCTREATLVHMVDNLGGRLGSFDRIEKELPDGQQWSSFDRALGGGAYFADRRAA